MGTKEKVLALFEKNKGIYLSGEEIADKLNVSRNSVWKAVGNLRKDGYEIDAVPSRGYCLSEDTDILSNQGISKYLKPICHDLVLEVLPEVASTNVLLREKAGSGLQEGYCVIANAQTKGKGRLGRSFYSPSDTGVYLSLLLRPAERSPTDAIKITTMAAVAACRAIEQVSEKQAQIKWVNDIFMDGKKVSGILTEASLNLETSSLDYVVLGIGINAYPPKEGFPKEIEQIAGAVFSKDTKDGKNLLAAEFLNAFMALYRSKEKDYVNTYREKSIVLGKEITVHKPEETRKAMALDVDENCHLLVQYEDGKKESLSSGEISIRLGE